MIRQNEIFKAKTKYFRQMNLWPLAATFDASGWLSNFQDKEKKYALQLLNNFLYFSKPLIGSIMRSAFLNISQGTVKSSESYNGAQMEWRQFISRTLVVRITGETPNDADSGYLFTRMARDKLQIPDNQIVSPEDALKKLKRNERLNIVFVDDFVGSGEQFISSWERTYTLEGSRSSASFSQLPYSIKSSSNFYYCPLVSTIKGYDCIAKKYPEVILCPAFKLDSRYSALEHDSYIWRDGFEDEGPEFVKTVSRRIGIPDTGGMPDDWRGFHMLGLSLAFDHGWPDATLPIYHWNRDGWKPLLKK